MVANASKFWDTEQGKAIDYGNLIGADEQGNEAI